MNVNDIVYLKSENEKLMITWLVDITTDPNSPIDINKALQMNPHYQPGDITIKYGTKGKAQLPGKCVIDSLSNRVVATDQILSVGNVVKHKLTDKEMTVTWIVGQQQASSHVVNINKLYEMNGFGNGDIVCGYFEKKEYKTHLFKAGEVTKIYE